jgi:hypothetical protein
MSAPRIQITYTIEHLAQMLKDHFSSTMGNIEVTFNNAGVTMPDIVAVIEGDLGGDPVSVGPTLTDIFGKLEDDMAEDEE